MKTFKFFLEEAVIFMLLTAGLMYLSLGFLNLLVFFLVPVFIFAILTQENEKASSISGGVAILLTYSVMYSHWAWTSIVLVIALIVLGFYRKPMKGLSSMAAWLSGFELAAIGMELYAQHVYFMDNLWHDFAVVVFAVYALTWDIHYNKKEVAY